jgi:hypothetical protein
MSADLEECVQWLAQTAEESSLLRTLLPASEFHAAIFHFIVSNYIDKKTKCPSCG